MHQSGKVQSKSILSGLLSIHSGWDGIEKHHVTRLTFYLRKHFNPTRTYSQDKKKLSEFLFQRRAPQYEIIGPFQTHSGITTTLLQFMEICSNEYLTLVWMIICRYFSTPPSQNLSPFLLGK